MNEDKGKYEHEASILKCLCDNYGIEGSLSRLPGENINYLVSVNDGERYVLKVVGDEIPLEAFEMVNTAIEHAVLNGFRPKLPRIVKNKYHRIKKSRPDSKVLIKKCAICGKHLTLSISICQYYIVW